MMKIHNEQVHNEKKMKQFFGMIMSIIDPL